MVDENENLVKVKGLCVPFWKLRWIEKFIDRTFQVSSDSLVGKFFRKL